MEPAANYVVAVQGNPQTISALTHLNCLVPHSKDRPSYNRDGSPDVNPDTKMTNRVLANSPRINFPIREDFKLLIRKAILKSLQVKRRAEEPHKWIRYPQEEGELKANLLTERIAWLMQTLDQSRQEATNTARQEMANFYKSEELDEQDPLGTLAEVSFVHSLPTSC